VFIQSKNPGHLRKLYLHALQDQTINLRRIRYAKNLRSVLRIGAAHCCSDLPRCLRLRRFIDARIPAARTEKGPGHESVITIDFICTPFVCGNDVRFHKRAAQFYDWK
jgi:hypothetical protein